MIALSKLKLKTVNPRNQLNTHFFSLSVKKQTKTKIYFEAWELETVQLNFVDAKHTF